MNIGVIGGSGFIGSHVVDKLIEAGHEITIFDMMKPQRDDVRHIYIDITDLSKTTVALTGAYDTVYMLAAMADVNDVYKNPVEAGHVNIMAVANVLEAARRNEIERVILASTVWVYSPYWLNKNGNCLSCANSQQINYSFFHSYSGSSIHNIIQVVYQG